MVKLTDKRIDKIISVLEDSFTKREAAKKLKITTQRLDVILRDKGLKVIRPHVKLKVVATDSETSVGSGEHKTLRELAP